MNKKLFCFFVLPFIIFLILTISILMVDTVLSFQDDTKEEVPGSEMYNEGFPYLSVDGKTLSNALPPRVLLVDPNPDAQNIRSVQDADIVAAIAGTRTAGVEFEITYIPSGETDLWGEKCTTFPEAAKTAFDAAATIWASRIQSSVPITIMACWANELPTGVLGYSGGGSWHRDFDGAPFSNTWYQAALANSFAGSDLDPTNADMHIAYNANFNWYYGTDGNPPAGQFDLVTVAAHEIAHGLHFAGMMQYSSGWAQFGWGGYPSIYDTFVESGGGNKVTSYENPSTALGTLVTSNDLWWNGFHANAANGGSRVKMYAPSTWAGGSSYSHLDYHTFTGTINSMMVYAIGSGSSQHDPGPVTMGILKDMGWQEPVQSPPSAPTGLTASAGTYEDKVRVSWHASDGATHYQVFRNISDTHTGETQLIGNHTASTFNDTSALPGITYYYWVKACNFTDCSDYSSSASGWWAESSPASPTGVSGSKGTFIDIVRISWVDSSFATHYEVYRNTTDNTTDASTLTSDHPGSPYDDTTAMPGVKYYYWVTACNLIGCSDFSDYALGQRAETIPAPTDVTASEGTLTDMVRITWETSSDATYFQVFRSTSDSVTDASKLIGNHPASPYDDTSAVPGFTYYYWVRACNFGGCSVFSSSVSGWRGVKIYLPLIITR